MHPRQSRRCAFSHVPAAARLKLDGLSRFMLRKTFDPPVELPRARLQPNARAQFADTGATCGESEITVTVYVAPGGQVLTAGASAADPQGAEQIECILDQVAGLDMARSRVVRGQR